MIINYINNRVIANATVMTGKETIRPYSTKSKNVNFTLLCLTKSENIIPANAPIGVKNAPMLLPIIEAYTACN